MFRVGSCARVSAETILFAPAKFNVSVLEPVSDLFVVLFVRSCSALGVLPFIPCALPATGGRRSCKNAVFSGLLCPTSPTIPRLPPFASNAGPDLPGKVVKRYAPTFSGLTRNNCWFPPNAGTSGPTPKPGPTSCFSIGEILFIRPASYMRFLIDKTSPPEDLCCGAI